MKKKIIVTGVAAIALVAALQTSSIFAAAPAEKIPSVYTAAPAEEKRSDDTNTDTVCNYCSGDCSFVDEDGDGICDNYKKPGTNGANAGKGFVDENGDGICDNYASRGQDGACGWGGGHGNHGHGGGCHRR